MEKLKTLRIYYFKETDSMDIWFDKPTKEFISEEVNDHILLKKSKEGNVIGVEIISLSALAKTPLEVPIKME